MGSLFTVTLPDIGEGVVEGEVIEWLKAVGTAVAQDEPVVIIMTDKATVELPAPYPGIVARHYVEPGAIAKLNKPLYDIDVEGDIPEQATIKERKEVAAKKSSSAEHAEGIKALPKTRHLAKELGIDLASIRGTGPDGRINVHDLKRPLATATHFDGDSEVPLLGVKGAMAKKMAESKREIPHFSYFEQAEATRLVQLRENVSRAAAEAGIHLTYMPFFIRALSMTITKFPEMNSSLEEKKLTIHKPHHIGIAMAMPEGLIVPVLKNVDQMNLETIIRSYDALVKKAKSKSLTPNEMKEGTITMSNYGVLGGGGRWATPIINPPEVAILGLARIHKGPFIKEDQITVKELLNVSWSFDHRVIDGSMGAQIAHFYTQLLQNPALLL